MVVCLSGSDAATAYFPVCFWGGSILRQKRAAWRVQISSAGCGPKSFQRSVTLGEDGKQCHGNMYQAPVAIALVSLLPGASQLLALALCQYNAHYSANLKLIDDRTRLVTPSSETEYLENLTTCAAELDAIYTRCARACPDFAVPPADFNDAVIRAVDKYLIGPAAGQKTPSSREIREFIRALHGLDLYLAVACTRGDEQAWWYFDRQHRSYIERLSHHLVRYGMDADEVIDSVYVALLGTKTGPKARESKFKTYTGRGTLRGWLRTLVWHAVVDLYRGRQTEMPLEEWSESDGKALENHGRGVEAGGSEKLMLANVVRERYRAATIAALDESLAALDDHETLLLLYYHVDGLRLREIARIVEQPASPIRRWFQRPSTRQVHTRPSRVHESTVMRWLEKVYRKTSDRFDAELRNNHGLNAAEIEICMAIATEDLGQSLNLSTGLAESKKSSVSETKKS